MHSARTGLAHSLREIFLYVSQPYVHAVRLGLFIFHLWYFMPALMVQAR